MSRNVSSLGPVAMVLASIAALPMVVSWPSRAVGQTPQDAKPVPAASTAAGEVWAVTGTASRGDPKDVAAKGEFPALGMLAARKAKEACKDRKPDLVLVFAFHWRPKTDEDRKQILDGVAESFDKKIVYGTSSGIPADLEGQRQSVAVLALGDVQHTTVKAALEKGKEDAAYTALAEGLKGPYAQAAGKGRLILILGSNAKTSNGAAIVNTFQTVLGKDVQLFGPGTPHTIQFFQGEPLTDALTAILVTGSFTCDFAMADADLTPQQIGKGGQDEEKILGSATKAVTKALGDKRDNVALVLAESCETRGHSLKKNLEEPVVAQAAKGIPGALLFVWSYGYEVGHPATGEPAIGTRSRIIVCVIRRAGPNPGK